MKREDFLLVLLAIILLAAMTLTVFFGGQRSRHGTGMTPHYSPFQLACRAISPKINDGPTQSDRKKFSEIT